MDYIINIGPEVGTQTSDLETIISDINARLARFSYFPTKKCDNNNGRDRAWRKRAGYKSRIVTLLYHLTECK